ncbi:MAG: MFS transporter [Spirochaetales bacterium]|nr:MFS transporter [Spirochaetales bacterium]
MFGNIKSVFTQYKGLSSSIYVIFIARVVTNMGAFIWPLLTMILSRKMGYSATTIAMISASVAVLFIPANIIGGKLADRFNKKKIIILFDSISVVFFIACGFIEPGTLMMIFFIIAGLFAHMEGPAFEALIVEASKPSEREKVFSLSYLGHNLGFMFGAAIGGLLFNNYLNLAFLIDGTTTMISTILIVIFVKVINVHKLEKHEKNEYEESEEEGVNTFAVLRKRRSVLIQMIVFTLGAFIYSQWSFALPLYLGELFGEDGPVLFGFLASFNGFIVIIFTPILTAFLCKMKELPKIMIGMALYSFSYLIIKDEPLKYVFYVMIFAFTIGEIINTIGASPFISRRVPASHRGRVSSYMGIGYMIGGIGGQLAVGVTIDKLGYNSAFNILVISGIIGVVIIAYNIRVDKALFPKLYELEAQVEEE